MKLLSFIQLLIGLYVGINEGSSHAQSPGGKVVLSIIYVIALLVGFFILDVLLLWVASVARGDRRSSYSLYRSTSSTTKASQEDALEALAERTRRKQAALDRGESPSEITADQVERDRITASELEARYQQRVKDAGGIVWPEG